MILPCRLPPLSQFGETALHVAAEHDTFPELFSGLSELPFSAADLGGARRADGLTPLHVAVQHESVRSLRRMVDTASCWDDAWALLYASAAPPGPLAGRWPSAAVALAQAKLRSLQAAAAAAAAASAAAPAAVRAASGPAADIVVTSPRPVRAPTAASLDAAANELSLARYRAECAAAAAAARTPLSLAGDALQGCTLWPEWFHDPRGDPYAIRVLLYSLAMKLGAGRSLVHFAARGAIVEVLRALAKDEDVLLPTQSAGPRLSGDEVRRIVGAASNSAWRHSSVPVKPAVPVW